MDKPHINIIDTSGVELSLIFDFRKNKESFSFYEFKNFIKNIFDIQYSKIEPLFINHTPQIIIINLEQEKKQSNSTTLACFDSYFSNDSELKFLIYYDSLIKLYSDCINKTNLYLNEFKDTVLHELMHALDLINLKKVRRNRQNSW